MPHISRRSSRSFAQHGGSLRTSTEYVNRLNGGAHKQPSSKRVKSRYARKNKTVRFKKKKQSRHARGAAPGNAEAKEKKKVDWHPLVKLNPTERSIKLQTGAPPPNAQAWWRLKKDEDKADLSLCSSVIKKILKKSLTKFGVRGIDDVDLATILLHYDINIYNNDLDNLYASCKAHTPETAHYDITYIDAFRRSIKEHQNGGPIGTIYESY